MQILIKQVLGKQARIIGWKGNVLEVMLPPASDLKEFLSKNVGVTKEHIVLSHVEGNIYLLEIDAKYIEDPVILLT